MTGSSYGPIPEIVERSIVHIADGIIQGPIRTYEGRQTSGYLQIRHLTATANIVDTACANEGRYVGHMAVEWLPISANTCADPNNYAVDLMSADARM